MYSKKTITSSYDLELSTTRRKTALSEYLTKPFVIHPERFRYYRFSVFGPIQDYYHFPITGPVDYYPGWPNWYPFSYKMFRYFLSPFASRRALGGLRGANDYYYF